MLHLSITSTTRIGKTRDEGEHGDERGREREKEIYPWEVTRD